MCSYSNYFYIWDSWGTSRPYWQNDKIKDLCVWHVRETSRFLSGFLSPRTGAQCTPSGSPHRSLFLTLSWLAPARKIILNKISQFTMREKKPWLLLGLFVLLFVLAFKNWSQYFTLSTKQDQQQLELVSKYSNKIKYCLVLSKIKALAQ